MRAFSDYSIDYQTIMKEIESVMTAVDVSQVQKFVELFNNKNFNKIVVAGAGRMGYAAKGFAMRLGHMGFNAWTIGDSTVPQIAAGDLLIVTSGSGNTQTIYDIALKAFENGASVALITNNLESRIGGLASTMIKLPNPNNKSATSRTSVQPMSTLNEQCLGLLLDTIVFSIMRLNDETHETMWSRHSNLE